MIQTHCFVGCFCFCFFSLSNIAFQSWLYVNKSSGKKIWIIKEIQNEIIAPINSVLMVKFARKWNKKWLLEICF
jgi:hypothetical protein